LPAASKRCATAKIAKSSSKDRFKVRIKDGRNSAVFFI